MKKQAETVRIMDPGNPEGRVINREDFDEDEHEYFTRDTPASATSRSKGRKRGATTSTRKPATRATKAADTKTSAATKVVDKGGKSE